MTRRVAIIPARGGSKRIPRKNIKPFNGLPIIAYSIRAAQKSALFDRVIVSTDDAEIADMARGFGAEVPFLRPSELSDDHATTHAVIAHAITQIDPEPDVVCCLYATAPFVRPKDISAAMDMVAQGDCTYVFPITTFAFPIQRALLREPGGGVRPLDDAARQSRSQDLPETWHDAGQFYCATAQTWRDTPNAYGTRARGLPVPRYLVQDIDTLEDWQQAELMHRALHAKNSL